MKKKFGIASLIVICTFLILLYGCSKENITPGLIGIYYSEPDMTSIKALTILEKLEQTWDESVDFQGETSGEWNGYLISPNSGKIKFELSSNFTVESIISGKKYIADKDNPLVEFEMELSEGESYPITLRFWHTGKKHESGSFSLKWAVGDEEYRSIPLKNFYHTEKESVVLDFMKDIDPKDIDISSYIYPEVEHRIVYYEEGRFAAWPANSGIWNWGNEILVAFTQGYNKENKYHHSVIYTKPMNEAFARSLDGGKSWQMEIVDDDFNYGKQPTKLKRRINFRSEGFGLKNREAAFWFTESKGRNWEGPFYYTDLGEGALTSRTDYLIEDNDEMLVFGSVKNKKVRAALKDKAITMKTEDGGKTFNFIGYMTESDTIRSVMPATVRINENHLVSAMRRRIDPPKNEKYGLAKNWIDVYQSFDNGKNWKFLAKIADTDTGIRNGNPPSMVKLKSGLLMVAYGYRAVPYSIRARISDDKGKTWSKQIILRDDARIWDIGYCRSVALPDDKVVTVYYYSTEDYTERHIAATIWEPNNILMNN